MIADLSEELISQYVWSRRNIRTEKGNRLDFVNFPFLKEIYQNSFAPEIVIKKAAQIGLSTWAMCHNLWLVEHFPVTIIYTLPTTGDCSAFSATRFNPIIINSYIKGDRIIDSVGIKQIGQGFIYFKGTWNEKEAISIPSDVNCHDEIDFSKMDVIEAYEERLSASFVKWRRYFSTPTLPDYGIAEKFKNSNRQEWLVPCSVCKKEQPILEENIIDEEFRCLKCRGVLNRYQGRFIAEGMGSAQGYHIPQAAGCKHTAKEVISKKERYKIRRLYYNAVWGVEYDEVSEVLGDIDIVNALTKEVPQDGKTIIGVDWGDTSWAVVLRGTYDKTLNRMVATIVYMEAIDNPDTTQHELRVLELMDRFNAPCCADFGYGDTKNKNIAKRYPYKFYMNEYKEGMLEAKLQVTKYGDLAINHIQVDRTISLEETIAEIKSAVGDRLDGIRISDSNLIDTYKKHARAIKPDRVTDKNGKQRVVLLRKGPDHLIHATNYARILLKLLYSNIPSVTIMSRK